MNMYDAAFGPMGSLALATDAKVTEAQQLLNAMGFGPLEVDGLIGPLTREALAQFYARRNQSSPGQVTDAVLAALREAARQSGSVEQVRSDGSKPPATAQKPAPIIKAFPWMTPTVIAASIVAASVIGYLWWRSKQKGRGGLFGADEDEDEDRKCRRLPEFTDGGEALKPVENE